MFGKFTVNSHDWCILEDYFKSSIPPMVDFYLGTSKQQSKPWASRQDVMKVDLAVYNLCVAKESRNQRIYAFYQKILQQYIYLCEAKNAQSPQSLSIIQKQIKLWQGYCQLSRICIKVFRYLDKFYVNDSQIQSIGTKAYSVYESVHLNQTRIIVLIKQLIIQFGQKRRLKSLQNDHLLKLSSMFKTISRSTGSGTYTLILQSINSLTGRFYQKLNQKWSLQSPQQQMNQIFQLLEFEDAINPLVLPQEDKDQFNKLFKTQIVNKFVPILLKHQLGLRLFFNDDRIQYIAKIYKLLKRYDNTEEFKKFYYNHIRSKGFQLFQTIKKNNQQNADQIINKFYEFYITMGNKTSQIFMGSNQFQIQLRKVMQIIIHLHDQEFNIVWKLVQAIYNYFRTNPVDKNIQPILIMFDCLTNKDIFIELYEADLTTRLLNNNCQFLKEEIKFIQTIKEKCGQNFTQFIELKIKDYLSAIKLSQEYVTNTANTNNNLIFSIKVLSKKSWTLENKPNPDYFPINILWPEQLIQTKNQFQTYYTSKNQNKHIQHLPLLSTTLLNVYYKGENGKISKYQIRTNLLQSSILVFIESKKAQVSESQILGFFQITPQQFNSQIRIFVVGNNPLILKGETGYYFNDNFNPIDNDLNIQIPNLRKNSKTETSNVDRDLAIQASIIKILKTNGKLEFDGLIQQVQIRLKFFKPALSKIKEAIEKLIERDYIERSADEINVFIYKA